MKFKIDDKEVDVDRKHYVKAKTKQLRSFGYSDLKEETVNQEIDAILAGKTLGNGLTVIGGFMEDEIVK